MEPSVVTIPADPRSVECQRCHRKQIKAFSFCPWCGHPSTAKDARSKLRPVLVVKKAA